MVVVVGAQDRLLLLSEGARDKRQRGGTSVGVGVEDENEPHVRIFLQTLERVGGDPAVQPAPPCKKNTGTTHAVAGDGVSREQ